MRIKIRAGLPPGAAVRLQIDDLTFDASSRQLWLNEAEVHLSTKAFDLLALLIERRPQAVSKADPQPSLAGHVRLGEQPAVARSPRFAKRSPTTGGSPAGADPARLRLRVPGRRRRRDGEPSDAAANAWLVGSPRRRWRCSPARTCSAAKETASSSSEVEHGVAPSRAHRHRAGPGPWWRTWGARTARTSTTGASRVQRRSSMAIRSGSGRCSSPSGWSQPSDSTETQSSRPSDAATIPDFWQMQRSERSFLLAGSAARTSLRGAAAPVPASTPSTLRGG